jgi:adenosine deaminase
LLYDITIFCSLSLSLPMTGTVPSIASHPFKKLHDLDFRVTLNTDDRLMSGITLTDEYLIAHQEFSLTAAQLYKITINGMKSSFQTLPYKKAFITQVLEPKYLALMADCGLKAELLQGLRPEQLVLELDSAGVSVKSE